tara:strand:+ start:469 stop:1056 length:588 start_codon:yes stop_codon:yes gene_type:complete
MKKLLLILILVFSFQLSVKADDLRDFEIEGMSIGESLLSYITLADIKIAEENPTYYKDKKFVVVFINKSSLIYELIQVTYSPNDNKYILEAVEGLIDYANDMVSCNRSRKKIIDEIISLVEDYKIVEDEGEHEGDTFGKSNAFSTWIYPNSGGYIAITCTDYSKEANLEKGWIDQLSVTVGSEKLKNFLMNEAYN